MSTDDSITIIAHDHVFVFACETTLYILNWQQAFASTNTFRTDQNDESLRKWKESLGIGSGNTLGDPSDPRKCVILSLGLEVCRVHLFAIRN